MLEGGAGAGQTFRRGLRIRGPLDEDLLSSVMPCTAAPAFALRPFQSDLVFACLFARRCSLSRTIALKSAAGRISNGLARTPGCFDMSAIA